MEAAVWTLIAIQAATVLGAFVYIVQRIDRLGERMDDGFTRLGREVRGGLSDLRSELRAEMATKADVRALGERLDANIQEHAG